MKNIFRSVSSRFIYYCYTDKAYLDYKFNEVFGHSVNWKNPVTFNEKMQWLKLYDRNPLYTQMVDKYEVRKYVSERIGEEYLIPCLGVWDRFDDIDFSTLPSQFVLKCTHDSGSVIVVKDKSAFNVDEARQKLEKCLKKNYFRKQREWPYKNVKPRIIAEKFMKDDNDEVLRVYKVFTFSGEPYLIQAIQNDKTTSETIDYYDCDWNFLNIQQVYPNCPQRLKKPNKLKEIIDTARRLSCGNAFLRVDLYEINGMIYFSEFTFYSDAGIGVFEPSYWDKKLGDLVVLPLRK